MNDPNHPDCEGKEGYDKKEANRKINYHREHYGRILRCYQCPNCMLWHLTHKVKYQDEEIRQKKIPKHQKKSKMKPYYYKTL